jgi:hypothetical protein
VMLFIKGTKVSEYDGERDWAEIVDYARRESGDPSYEAPKSAVVSLGNSNFTDFARNQQLMMVSGVKQSFIALAKVKER